MLMWQLTAHVALPHGQKRHATSEGGNWLYFLFFFFWNFFLNKNMIFPCKFMIIDHHYESYSFYMLIYMTNICHCHYYHYYIMWSWWCVSIWTEEGELKLALGLNNDENDNGSFACWFLLKYMIVLLCMLVVLIKILGSQ